MQYLHTVIVCLASLLVLAQCSKDEDPSTQNFLVEIEITDADGLAVEGAEVQVLESGTIKATDNTGTVGFSDADLLDREVKAITDSVTYAFSVKHTAFRPREFNAASGKVHVILTPDSTATYHYGQPVQLDDGIETGTLADAGFNEEKIQSLMEKIAKPGYRDLHSILVYKDGKLVLEEYYFGNNDTIQFENGIIRDKSPAPIWWSRNEKHYLASVNKALTGTLTGIALEQAGLSTAAFVKDYLPAYDQYFQNDAKKSSVTFHHALNMTLGFQWDEWGSNDLALLWKSDDFAEFLLSRSNKGPDTEWYYNSASPNLLLKCIETMVEQDVRQWADENFYAKLGITDYKWQNQPDGYPEGAARMYLRPRDMLKIGITYLNNGKWKNEQVIPESWVEKCLTVEERPSAGNYSHFFWIRNLKGVTYLSADGDGGNFINIFPEQKMVIVFTQGNYLQWPLYVNQANDIMGNYIFPAMN